MNKFEQRLCEDYFLSRFAFLGMKSLPTHIIDAINTRDFSYRRLEEAERQKLQAQINAELLVAKRKKVGAHRADLWERAWSDVKNDFIGSGYDVQSLNPKFVGKSKFIRLNGEYVEANDLRFELSYFEIVRAIIGHFLLSDVSNVYEFGSGSGFNLAYYAAAMSQMSFFGTDWSQGAVDILNLLSSELGLPINGQRFDLFNPDPNYEILRDSAVVTFCAFEQLGNGFQPMLNFLCSKKPAIIVQMEPIAENYVAGNEFDDNALNYHSARNYLNGYAKELQDRQDQGSLIVEFNKRLQFGSLFQECYSILVWRPL